MPKVCVTLSPHLMPLSATSQYVALTPFSQNRRHSDASRRGMRWVAATCAATYGGGGGGGESGRRHTCVRHARRLARVAQRALAQIPRAWWPGARAWRDQRVCGDVAEGDVREAAAGGRALVVGAPHARSMTAARCRRAAAPPSLTLWSYARVRLWRCGG